ncbi:MAG: hypothetical protein Q8K60_07790 [Parachlamydiaceae bacterium]|nr:hypothetical protein [Parachlamydiaceae bacterium]
MKPDSNIHEIALNFAHNDSWVITELLTRDRHPTVVLSTVSTKYLGVNTTRGICGIGVYFNYNDSALNHGPEDVYIQVEISTTTNQPTIVDRRVLHFR